MKRILTILFLLLCSFSLFAQRQIELKEVETKPVEVIPVMVELINDQEILTVSDDNDTIRIPLTEESKADIDVLLDAQWALPKD